MKHMEEQGFAMLLVFQESIAYGNLLLLIGRYAVYISLS